MKTQRKVTTGNSRTWILLVVVLSLSSLANNVIGQCLTHTPTENGKDLKGAILTKKYGNILRWSDSQMTYRVQNTTRFWYGADIAFAKNQWNKSSYKGTNSSFEFIDGGSTNAPVDYNDYNNVIGIKNITPTDIVAQTHKWYFTATGQIYEADIYINSISVLHIQPHRLAGSGDLCVQNALCQEFGHALGLKDLKKTSPGAWVEYIRDTMWWEMERGEHKKESLECDDKWGTYWLYDSGQVASPAAPSAQDILRNIPEITLLDEQGIPTRTELIGNYPNPFNPETWIAYTLSEDSDISIQIYDSKGQTIRWLSLGMKPVGVYVEKDSAAYWDGRTDAGEEVTSGVYFYSLNTGSSIYTKKMIIVK